MVEGWQRANRPLSPLAGPYGRPLHPALVTVPIGSWLGSLVFDEAPRVGGPATPLAIGSGLAQRDRSRTSGACRGPRHPGPAAGSRWHEAMRIGLTHMALKSDRGDALLGGTHPPRTRQDERGVPASLTGLSAAGFALLAVSGHLGGEPAYRYGVRVADESAQQDGYRPVQDGYRPVHDGDGPLGAPS